MKIWTRLLLFGLVLVAFSAVPVPSTAQDCDAYCVIAAVNAFRTANGLPALQIDNALMAAAQAQSDYQAAISQVTHVGSGGSSATQRAIAYGFGNGAKVFVSENIAGGMTMTIEKAIYEYWQDSLHLQTMLNPASLYIGAGVGVANGYTYYTVDIGHYVGAPGSGEQDTSDSGVSFVPPTVASESGTDPFVKSTPQDDGAIIHGVAYGQSLIGIANTYEVEVAEVLKLNNLTLNSIIYPGDQIIIKPSYTPTVTESATSPDPSAMLTATEMPRLTQTPTPTEVTLFIPPTQTPSITPSPTPLVISPEREPMVVGAVLFALVVFVSVIIGGLIKSNNNSQKHPGA